jgi:hydrogenase expression/formation protein HypC
MCLAIPGRVESVRDEAGLRMGRVDFGGVVKDVCLACVPDIAVGEWALVHVGFAIARIDEAAAHDTLRALAVIDGHDDGHDAPEPPGAGSR